MGDSRDNRGGLEHRPVVPGATGLAGAAGREGSVQGLLSRSYDAGFHAPQYDFDGEVYRGVKSPYADTFLDHTKGAKWGGRYNAPGLSLIYTSPSASEAAGEAGAYEGMGERSLMRSRYSASLDPTTGTGGVADLFRGMYAENLAESAVTVPKGKGQGPLSYRVLGEHPYSMSQQMGKGATDAGASAIQAPSATGGEQIDIIPRNTAPSQIQPIDRVPYDRAGAPQAVEPATTAKPMPPDLMAQKPGMLDMRAGSRDRASSLRYGALGGGVASLGSDLYERVANGRNVSGGEMVVDTAAGTAIGGGSALAFDALAPRLGAGMPGALKAGGAVGGLLEGGFSTIQNAEAYRAGQQTASQATANTLVDTGVGLGAGATGAAIGASIGSIIPGAGTAIGAGLGFLGGMAGSFLVHKLADQSGFSGWAKHGLNNALSGAERPLGTMWNGVSTVTHPVAEGASTLYHGAANGLNSAGSALSNGAGRLWNWMTK
jgi:hypothetical protein